MQIQTKDLLNYQNSEIKVEFEKIKSALAPHTKRAYFVGGCVRDALLGLACYDYDIEIYDLSPELFDSIMSALGAKGVGKSFFVYKLGAFDLALARLESKSGFGHRGFEVRVCNDERSGSLRRDFSINALMLNIFDNRILDFHSGRADLLAKQLRVVSEQTFCDDSLRVLRAVQFVARFNLKIEKKSLELMRSIDISDLSSERVRMELNKLFGAKYLKKGLLAMRELGLDVKLFGSEFSDDFISRAISHAKITKNHLSIPYDIFCEYGVLLAGFESVKKQTFLKRASAKKLCELALKIPLKNWLGLNTKARINLAKKMGIFDEKLRLSLDENELKRLEPKERERLILRAKKSAINTAISKIKGQK